MTGEPTPAHLLPEDEVDQVVAAWRRERPDLDTAPMQVWSRILRLAQLLDAARSRAFAGQDLQGWEFDVLAALRRAGAPYRLSPGQLACRTHVTSGTMTNRVDGLARRGFVTRLAHPTDGRGVLVELNSAGRAAVDAALADLVGAEQTLMAGLDTDSRVRLGALLRQLLISQ